LREEGENTYDYAMDHLRHLGYSYADDVHLTVLRDTSNKQARQDKLMQTHDVIVFPGGTLNDFRRK
jgi:predicted secreted acid phosphatase